MMHYQLFRFNINMGMKVKKILSIYRLKPSAWLGGYIDHNTQRRTKAKTPFENDNF